MLFHRLNFIWVWFSEITNKFVRLQPIPCKLLLALRILTYERKSDFFEPLFYSYEQQILDINEMYTFTFKTHSEVFTKIKILYWNAGNFLVCRNISRTKNKTTARKRKCAWRRSQHSGLLKNSTIRYRDDTKACDDTYGLTRKYSPQIFHFNYVGSIRRNSSPAWRTVRGWISSGWERIEANSNNVAERANT